MSATPIPLQIGVILNIVTIPPSIFCPSTIRSHSNGMPKMNDKIRNWTRKFAGEVIALNQRLTLEVCLLVTSEVNGENCEAGNVKQPERTEHTANRTAERMGPRDFRIVITVARITVIFIASPCDHEAWRICYRVGN